MSAFTEQVGRNIQTALARQGLTALDLAGRLNIPRRSLHGAWRDGCDAIDQHQNATHTDDEAS